MYYETGPRHGDLLAESFGITIANSVCSPGVHNPDVARKPESKADDTPSEIGPSTIQVSGDKVESAVTAHATHQSLKPSDITEPQNSHELLCALSDDYNYINKFASRSQSKSVRFSADAYSRVYGALPSAIVATSSGWESVSQRANHYNEK